MSKDKNEMPSEDTLIYSGEAVKAVELDDGKVKLGGYLVRYTSKDNLDLEGDFFAPDTDYGKATMSLAWFNHRMPVTFEGKSVEYKDQLPDASLVSDDIGVFAEVILGARNEYEKLIAEIGIAGKLSWSSGTAGHLIDRQKQDNGAYKITRWILGLDASLTPTPAEPKNVVMPVKSLISTTKLDQTADAGRKEGDEKLDTIEEETMDEQEVQALFNSALEATVPDMIQDAVDKTVKAMQPDVEPGHGITVIEDEADKAKRLNPFKSLGEMLVAIRQATLEPWNTDKRLRGEDVKSSGLNEAIPSQGGFLVSQTIAAGLLENTWGVGEVLQYFTPMAIGPNSNGMLFNAIAETNRADGSRAGGILGYWIAEGEDKTATKQKFHQLDLKLKKVAAACYATDELLDDAVALESWIMRYVPEELKFKVEDAIIEGNGVGKPLGILNGGSFVQATRLNATQINTADILNMWARRYVGSKDYVWFGNADIGPYLHQMTLGNYPVYMPPGGLSQAPYGTLMGRPYVEIEYCPTLGTVGDLMLVSPSQYALIDKGGVEGASSIHVKFLQDETTFRFVYRIDGEPAWNLPVTPFKGSNTVSPFVGLAATT